MWTRPRPCSLLVPLLVVCALCATAASAQPADCDPIGPYFSTSTGQFTPAGSLFPQTVYLADPPDGPVSVVASFLPASLNLDALHVLDESTLLFSVDRNGYVSTPSGLVRLLHDQVYRADLTAGVAIALDGEWAALDLRPGSLDALFASPGGCFAFSTSANGVLSHGGRSVWARPWQVYRACPSRPIELLLDVGTLGVPDVDALHVVGGLGLEFSSSSDRVLAGGARVWNQNVYRCVPAPPWMRCEPDELVVAFDGVAEGLRDLDAYGGDDIVARLDLDAIRAHQAALQAIADANGGDRVAGEAGYDESVDYVVSQLLDAGYWITYQTFRYDTWRLDGPPVLRQTAPLPAVYADQTDYAVMGFSGAGDVTAPVAAVDLSLGDPSASTSGCEAADFAGFTPGSIALIQRGACFFYEKAENAEAAGAVGVIVFNSGTPSQIGLFLGTLTDGYGGGLPVVATTFDRGVEWAGTPALTMRLAVDTFRGEVETRNLLADRPVGSADRAVIVGARLDSLPSSPGIQNNGAGSAALLELAKQLACVETVNRVKFAWWPSWAPYADRGSTRFVDQLSPSELESILAYLNVDTIASPNFVRFVYDGDGSSAGPPGPPRSGSIEAGFAGFYEARGLPFEPIGLGQVDSDHIAFRNAEIPIGGVFSGNFHVKTASLAAIYGGTVGEQYDPCYALACDTFDNVSLEALEQNAGAVAHVTLGLAMVP